MTTNRNRTVDPASHPLDRFAVEGKSAVITGALGAGIAATVWTSSLTHPEAMIDGLECGKVSVNSPGFPYPGLPEGGKKASGYGRDLGPESLDGYLHSKTVIFERS